jgi:hypothetical protein
MTGELTSDGLGARYLGPIPLTGESGDTGEALARLGHT